AAADGHGDHQHQNDLAQLRADRRRALGYRWSYQADRRAVARDWRRTARHPGAIAGEWRVGATDARAASGADQADGRALEWRRRRVCLRSGERSGYGEAEREHGFLG